MDYTRLTPETIEKLRQFDCWFGGVKKPQAPHLRIQPALKSAKDFHLIDHVDLYPLGKAQHHCVRFSKDETYYLPDDIYEKAFNLYQKADEVFSRLYFLYHTGKERTILANTILYNITNAIPFDPTRYTEGIQGIVWMLSIREEYGRLEGELEQLEEEIAQLKAEILPRQREEKPLGRPHIPNNLPKLRRKTSKIPLIAAFLLAFVGATLVTAVLTVYLLNP